jgi:glycosyltransferase involved in cell wall biosynthesis
LFLGRIHPKKGLRELLQAWALLKARSADVASTWRLAIAGWDDSGHLPELRRLVSTLSLEGDVIFPGPLFGEDKERALANAGAFVLPSFSEGLPMSVLEAWAYGRPAFITDACNLSEAFDGGAALLISTSPEALATELAQGLQRTDLPEFGRRGRALIEARYTWRSIAASQAAVYRWMRDGGDPPDCVSLAAA